MKSTCEFCGSEIAVADGLEDGSSFACPNCNRQNIHRKPSRIELPLDPPAKPKLGIRRERTVSTASPGATEFVSSVDRRVGKKLRQERIARARKRLVSLFAYLVLAGIGVGGYKLWQMWGSGEINRLELPEAIKSLVPANNEEQDSQPGMSHVGNTGETESSAISKVGQLAEKLAGSIGPKPSERYREIEEAFANSRLRLWKHLDKNRRPGKVDGRFFAMIPESATAAAYYAIESSTSGMQIFKVHRNLPDETVELAAFEDALGRNGGLVMYGDVAYALRPKSVGKTFEVPARGQAFNPAKAYFGGLLYDCIANMGINKKGLAYEVSFAHGGNGKTEVVDAVGFGNTVAYDRLGKLAEPHVLDERRKAFSDGKAVKPYRRTVVFYDGAYVTKGANGITKVPRSHTSNDRVGYREWARLKNEANRQEQEMSNREQELRARKSEMQGKLTAPVSEGEIATWLGTGKLLINIKEGVK